jgi:phage terminase large subunit
MLFDINREDIERLSSIGRQNPVKWIRHVLGVDLWSAQQLVANSVRDHRNTQVDSCHGIGKTRVLASIGLCFLFSYPRSRVVATAPTFRQVQSILFPEVHTLHAGAAIELGGTLNETEVRITKKRYFQGMSTNMPSRFQGQHAEHILFIVDEDYGVLPGIFEAIRGGMSSGFVRFLGAGNPTDPGAWIAEAIRKRDDRGNSSWNHIQVSAFDTPNFTKLGITIEDMRSGEWREKQAHYLKKHESLPRPYLINPEFVAEALIEFGEDSPAWQARVMGQLPSESTNTVIPLAWIEAAMQRWEHSVAVDARKVSATHVIGDPNYVPAGDPEEIGVDVARYGDDDSVIAPRRGRRLLKLVIYRKMDGYEIAGLVDAEHTNLVSLSAPLKEGEAKPRGRLIKVDSNGLGVSVVDPLVRMKHWVQGINVSHRPLNPLKYEDRTTELWWHLRELLHPLQPYPIALPRDNKLLGELSGRRYTVTKDNKLMVEDKDSFKKRLNRSPDRADAVMLAFAPPIPGPSIR